MKIETQHPITQAVKELLRGACHDKASLFVGEVAADHSLEINVVAGLEDYAILVGRGGERVFALMALVQRAGDSENTAARLNLCKAEGSPRPRHFQPFKYNPDFDVSAFCGLFYEWCGLVGVPLEGITVESPETETATLEVRIPAADDDVAKRSKIQDLNAVFYPYGYAQGRRIDIKAS